VVHQLKLTSAKQKIQAILLANVLVLALIMQKINVMKLVMLLQKKLINKKQRIKMINYK
jgi:hypothetical protein